MKKTFKLFAAALAIVAAASCAKEVNVDTPVDEPSTETVHMTISASFDVEGETKTVLAENNLVHWTDEDAIRLFYTYDTYDWYLNDGVFSIDPASNDADPTFAVFSGDTKPSKKYYAVSPAAGWSAPSYMYFQYDGLHTQNAVKDSFDPTKHLAMSVNTSGDVFKFQNACALLKVKVVGENVYSIKVDGAVGVMDDYYSTPIGIGMPIRFRPGSIDLYQFNYTYGHSSSIVLANGANPLENGATYYIVVPHFTVKNFNVSLCDANGNALVTKSKASDFKIERNKIYDLGTLEVPNESIEVSSTSISLAATNASASFKVIANAEWTASSSASWLTVSPSSGAATSSSGTTVTVTAAENTSTQNRTATITIKGAFVTKTISVTQEKCKTYKSVKQLTHATELEDGKLYVISYMKDSKYFWTENGQWIELAYFSSSYVSDNEFTANQVFKFHKVNTTASIGSYNTTVVGMWQSMSNNNYMSSTPAMNGTSNDASYVAIGQWNGWEKDFDMYIGTSSDNTLYYNGSRVAKGSIGTAESNNRGQQARKWYIYEVTER